MHDNRIQASCLFGIKALPHHLLKKKKKNSDGMKWNGQGLTADSNEIHYVGVKEVTNNKAWTANRTSPLQHSPRN